MHNTDSKKLVWLNLLLSLAILILLLQSSNPRAQEKGQIEINQQETMEVLPDEATVVFSIVTEGETPQEAIDANTEINNKLIAFFKDKYEVETTRYSLNKKTRWDPKTQELIELGYEARNTISVKTKNLDLTGKIIEDGISLGANEIQSVYFSISEEKQEELKEQLLKEALTNARIKAETIAETSGVKLGDIIKIIPYENTYYPVFRAFDVKGLESNTPEIMPEKQTIRYSVDVVFEIK